MEVLAIIPARGGSKGIKRKNLQIVAGQPLLAHTIIRAQHCQGINRIVVSTDDREIAHVSKGCGAEVVERPAELSGDDSPSEAAILHVLDYLDRTQNYRPSITVFMECTSPLVRAQDVDSTIQKLVDSGADAAFTAVPFVGFVWKQSDDGSLAAVNHDIATRPMRQAREPQFLEAGAVWAMKTDGFKRAKHRFFGKVVVNTIRLDRFLDIDEPRDLLVADELLREQQEDQRAALLPDRISAVVFDFDGVFTDNRVLVFEDGKEAVLCHRGDGLGLERLRSLQIPLIVLSSEKNKVVSARCRKLGLLCFQGIGDKLAFLKSWLSQMSIDEREVVYVGNDLNDKECLQYVGCGVVVNDAHESAKASARVVLSSKGGAGGIRELTDLVEKKVYSGGR